MIIVRQDRNAFYNWDNVIDIYINGLSRTEILLKHVKGSNESTDYPIGKYKNEENAKAAFKRLVENISKRFHLLLCEPMKKLRKAFTRRTEIAIEEIFERN